MNLREVVKTQYGAKVLDVLDRYAEISYQQSCDYAIGRTDRREVSEGQLLALKEQLVSLRGPITTVRIHVASTVDRDALIKKIEDFHDVDDALRKHYENNLGVQLDSECSEMFVFANVGMAPHVVEKLEEIFPGISWARIPQSLDLSSVTVLANWNQARDWLKLKNQPE